MLKEIPATLAFACTIVCYEAKHHLQAIFLYTQPNVLDDNVPDERKLGITAGFSWGDVADATVVYTDYGISKGMREGIKRAEAKRQPVEYRELFKED